MLVGGRITRPEERLRDGVCVWSKDSVKRWIISHSVWQDPLCNTRGKAGPCH